MEQPRSFETEKESYGGIQAKMTVAATKGDKTWRLFFWPAGGRIGNAAAKECAIPNQPGHFSLCPIRQR